VLAGLASCNTLTSENEGELSLYLENAANYYQGHQYLRAYRQWDKALEIDSENEKARLGQAMALYQMGRVDSKESIVSLSEAERRLDELRRSRDLGDLQWHAELGYALTEQRWAELLDRKLRKLDEDARQGAAVDPKLVATAKGEFDVHVEAARQSFERVLAAEEREPRDRLTCWLGLARIATWRSDFATALEYAARYEKQVMRSEKMWKDQAKRFPKDAPLYEEKQHGAESQEAELRDLMANCLFKLGRLDDAENELLKVVKLFPDRASAYLNLGIVREARGDLDLAAGDYGKFLALADLPETDPAVVEARRRLAGVESRMDGSQPR
jgi:tetratricopeptide (TPR) repeat protein